MELFIGINGGPTRENPENPEKKYRRSIVAYDYFKFVHHSVPRKYLSADYAHPRPILDLISKEMAFTTLPHCISKEFIQMIIYDSKSFVQKIFFELYRTFARLLRESITILAQMFHHTCLLQFVGSKFYDFLSIFSPRRLWRGAPSLLGSSPLPAFVKIDIIPNVISFSFPPLFSFFSSFLSFLPIFGHFSSLFLVNFALFARKFLYICFFFPNFLATVARR